MEDKVWRHATFSKNRERLLDEALMSRLFQSVLKIARRHRVLSEEHFSVNGTLIDAWASHRSFRTRDDDDDTPTDRERDLHGERRRTDTHASATEPDAERMRKSKGMEARLRYGVHHLVENRHHLVVSVKTEPAASVPERTVALDMLGGIPGDHRITVRGDKGYDTRDFVEECRELKITPHVAQNTERRGGSALDGRTTRHAGYAVSQRKRKLIETTFGRAKQYGGLRRMMYRGRERVSARVAFTMTVFNLLRISHLVPEPAG
jgi:IS5 family transposase